MTYTSLLYEVNGAIARITVNRPDKLNALNAGVIAELDGALGEIERDPAIRGVVLTGAGPKAFVAGADIAEIAAQGPVDGKARALEGQRVFRRLERCGRPVIAAVNGFALGGGCELAMACHLRVAAENARFGQPEVKLGIGPGYGGTVRLPRLVGRGRALELLLTGAMIDAQEALRIGLVNRVVPRAELLPNATATARTLARKPQEALRRTKALLRGDPSALHAGMAEELEIFDRLLASPETQAIMAGVLKPKG